MCVCVCLCVRVRDNILLASNLSPGSETSVVWKVCPTLSAIWNLEVLCDYLDSGQAVCTGQCLSNTVRALGNSMIVGAGAGSGSADPAALNADCTGWPLSPPPPPCSTCIPSVHPDQ